MKRTRIAPLPQGAPPTVRFDTAEDAWFWFVRCHVMRRDGARLRRSALSFARPCEPDDIYRWVRALTRAGRIGPPHLDVLERYGLQGRSPNRRSMAEGADGRRWDEALDKLGGVLCARGVLAP